MITTGKTLRALTLEDIKQCFFILLEHRSLGFHQIHMWTLNQFVNELNVGGGFGVFNNGKLQSFIMYRVSSDWIEITCVATDPWLQRNGLMKLLMQHLVQRASSLNPSANSIKLEVHEHNLSALKVYKQSGFKVDGVRKNYFGTGQNAVLMTLELQNHKSLESDTALV